VHSTDAPSRSAKAYLLGITFAGIEPEMQQTILRYVWRRVRELYPSQAPRQRPETGNPPISR